MKKFIVFLFVFLFVLPCFSATTLNSGSSLYAPTLEFKSWRVGRGGGSNPFDPAHHTFITSTETTCYVLASVGYTGNLNRNTTAPIKPETVSWAFELTHGMQVAEPPGTSWTGSHPAVLHSSTAF